MSCKSKLLLNLTELKNLSKNFYSFAEMSMSCQFEIGIHSDLEME